MTTHIPSKDSPSPIESKDYDIECHRCGGRDFRAYLSFRHRDGMGYIFEDSATPIPEEERQYIYICRRCDWKLMNGFPEDYSDDEALDDEEEAKREL